MGEMRSDLTEKIARAICLATFKDEAVHGDARCCQVGGKDGCCVADIHDQAIAAMDAIRAAGYVIVPHDISNEACDAALRATGSWLDIKGSGLTINREKMRRALAQCPDLLQEPNGQHRSAQGWRRNMSCPKCRCEQLAGPHQNVGLCETVWNSYRCTECGFTTVEPADDDWRERQMLEKIAHD